MKEYKNNEELIDYLVSKNVTVNNIEQALENIEQYSYYSIVNSYKFVFKEDVTNNTEFVDSMLGMLNFSFYKELKRKRYVYFKDGVKFEIDNYTQPAMKVAAIEGEKEKVDKVYNELKKFFDV